MKCRTLSIPTVHFKRQLNLPPTPNLTSIQTRHFNTESRLSPQSIYDGLKSSAQNGILQKGRNLHAYIIKAGHNSEVLRSQLFNLYIKCKEISDASKLFDEMPERNVLLYNKLIYAISGINRGLRSKLHLGLRYFRRMLNEIVKPDHITFTGLFRICVEMNDIVVGKMLHCRVVKVDLCEDCFISSALVDLYGKFGLVQDAKSIFDYALRKDLVLWNVMISCYTLNSLGSEAFGVYNLMRLKGYNGDDFTFTSLLNACASLGSFDLGRQIHGNLVRRGWDIDVVVASALVDMYAKNGNIGDARKAFDEMVCRNVISWTTIIVGCGQHGGGNEATKLLKEMLREGFVPDELTLASVLSSCGNTSIAGEIVEVHAYAMKMGYTSFTSVVNALMTAYSKCGSITYALQCFSSISVPDLVSWTSMIGALAFHGSPEKAVELFEKMLLNGLKPDNIAFLEVLAACAHGGLLSKGLHYFVFMIEGFKLVPNSEHYTCLVDLLGRAGLLNEAFDILMSMPMEPGPDALGAFLGSCQVHGNIELAKWAAEKLLRLEPNKPVNYTLVSDMYASTGGWSDVAGVRKTMRDKRFHKTPGCSWVEIAGKTHTSVSSEISCLQDAEAHPILGILHKLIEDEEVNPVRTKQDKLGPELYLIP